MKNNYWTIDNKSTSAVTQATAYAAAYEPPKRLSLDVLKDWCYCNRDFNVKLHIDGSGQLIITLEHRKSMAKLARAVTDLEDWQILKRLDAMKDAIKKSLTENPTPPVYKRKASLPVIKKVIFSDPVTVIIWADKTKTLVRANDGEVYDPEKGMALAISKRGLGTNESLSNYYDEFKKWLPKDEEEKE